MAVHGFRQSDNNFNKENNCYSNRCILNETSNKKIRLAKFRTLYCTNTVMTLHLFITRYSWSKAKASYMFNMQQNNV